MSGVAETGKKRFLPQVPGALLGVRDSEEMGLDGVVRSRVENPRRSPAWRG